jgi:hypothetical protein
MDRRRYSHGQSFDQNYLVDVRLGKYVRHSYRMEQVSPFMEPLRRNRPSFLNPMKLVAAWTFHLKWVEWCSNTQGIVRAGYHDQTKVLKDVTQRQHVKVWNDKGLSIRNGRFLSVFTFQNGELWVDASLVLEFMEGVFTHIGNGQTVECVFSV